MKNSFMLLLMCITIATSACDICGGGSHLFSSGIQPQFTRNYIGFQSAFRSYTTSIFDDDMGVQLNSNERMRSGALTFRFGIKNKLFIGATLPFVNNTRVFADSTQHVTGLGDTQFQLSYFVYRTPDPTAKWRNYLILTATGKMPFTRDVTLREQSLAVAMRRSTHAWAYGFQVAYTGRTDHYGITTSVATNWNTVDATGYKMGNAYAWNNALQYFNRLGNLTYVAHLNAALRLETPDKESGDEVHTSGTKRVLGGAGVDVYYKNWALTSLVQHGFYNKAGDGILDQRVEANLSLVRFF